MFVVHRPFCLHLFLFLYLSVCLSLADDGALFTWGANSWGCLGHGDEKDCSEPRQVNALADKPVSLVACGANHMVVATSACMFACFPFTRLLICLLWIVVFLYRFSVCLRVSLCGSLTMPDMWFVDFRSSLTVVFIGEAHSIGKELVAIVMNTFVSCFSVHMFFFLTLCLGSCARTE